jgi:conjugative transfer signal peptidase TraF
VKAKRQPAVLDVLRSSARWPTDPVKSAHAKTRFRLLGRVTGTVLLLAVGAGVAGGQAGLACNRTESLPLGVYETYPLGDHLEHGEVVALDPPAGIREMVLERGYLRPNERFFKRVLALPGDHVCVAEGRFQVNGVTVGPVFQKDREGRPLPSLAFCGAVAPGQFWVGSTFERSFDSRYFGPVAWSDLRGRLEERWTF